MFFVFFFFFLYSCTIVHTHTHTNTHTQAPLSSFTPVPEPHVRPLECVQKPEIARLPPEPASYQVYLQLPNGRCQLLRVKDVLLLSTKELYDCVSVQLGVDVTAFRLSVGSTPVDRHLDRTMMEMSNFPNCLIQVDGVGKGGAKYDYDADKKQVLARIVEKYESARQVSLSEEKEDASALSSPLASWQDFDLPSEKKTEHKTRLSARTSEVIAHAKEAFRGVFPSLDREVSPNFMEPSSFEDVLRAHPIIGDMPQLMSAIPLFMDAFAVMIKDDSFTVADTQDFVSTVFPGVQILPGDHFKTATLFQSAIQTQGRKKTHPVITTCFEGPPAQADAADLTKPTHGAQPFETMICQDSTMKTILKTTLRESCTLIEANYWCCWRWFRWKGRWWRVRWWWWWWKWWIVSSIRELVKLKLRRGKWMKQADKKMVYLRRAIVKPAVLLTLGEEALFCHLSNLGDAGRGCLVQYLHDYGPTQAVRDMFDPVKCDTPTSANMMQMLLANPSGLFNCLRPSWTRVGNVYKLSWTAERLQSFACIACSSQDALAWFPTLHPSMNNQLLKQHLHMSSHALQHAAVGGFCEKIMDACGFERRAFVGGISNDQMRLYNDWLESDTRHIQQVQHLYVCAMTEAPSYLQASTNVSIPECCAALTFARACRRDSTLVERGKFGKIRERIGPLIELLPKIPTVPQKPACGSTVMMRACGCREPSSNIKDTAPADRQTRASHAHDFRKLHFKFECPVNADTQSIYARTMHWSNVSEMTCTLARYIARPLLMATSRLYGQVNALKAANKDTFSRLTHLVMVLKTGEGASLSRTCHVVGIMAAPDVDPAVLRVQTVANTISAPVKLPFEKFDEQNGIRTSFNKMFDANCFLAADETDAGEDATPLVASWDTHPAQSSLAPPLASSASSSSSTSRNAPKFCRRALVLSLQEFDGAADRVGFYTMAWCELTRETEKRLLTVHRGDAVTSPSMESPRANVEAKEAEEVVAVGEFNEPMLLRPLHHKPRLDQAEEEIKLEEHQIGLTAWRMLPELALLGMQLLHGAWQWERAMYDHVFAAIARHHDGKGLTAVQCIKMGKHLWGPTDIDSRDVVLHAMANKDSLDALMSKLPLRGEDRAHIRTKCHADWGELERPRTWHGSRTVSMKVHCAESMITAVCLQVGSRVNARYAGYKAGSDPRYCRKERKFARDESKQALNKQRLHRQTCKQHQQPKPERTMANLYLELRQLMQSDEEELPAREMKLETNVAPMVLTTRGSGSALSTQTPVPCGASLSSTESQGSTGHVSLAKLNSYINTRSQEIIARPPASYVVTATARIDATEERFTMVTAPDTQKQLRCVASAMGEAQTLRTDAIAGFHGIVAQTEAIVRTVGQSLNATPVSSTSASESFADEEIKTYLSENDTVLDFLQRGNKLLNDIAAGAAGEAVETTLRQRFQMLLHDLVQNPALSFQSWWPCCNAAYKDRDMISLDSVRRALQCGALLSQEDAVIGAEPASLVLDAKTKEDQRKALTIALLDQINGVDTGAITWTTREKATFDLQNKLDEIDSEIKTVGLALKNIKNKSWAEHLTALNVRWYKDRSVNHSVHAEWREPRLEAILAENQGRFKQEVIAAMRRRQQLTIDRLNTRDALTLAILDAFRVPPGAAQPSDDAVGDDEVAVSQSSTADQSMTSASEVDTSASTLATFELQWARRPEAGVLKGSLTGVLRLGVDTSNLTMDAVSEETAQLMDWVQAVRPNSEQQPFVVGKVERREKQSISPWHFIFAVGKWLYSDPCLKGYQDGKKSTKEELLLTDVNVLRKKLANALCYILVKFATQQSTARYSPIIEFRNSMAHNRSEIWDQLIAPLFFTQGGMGVVGKAKIPKLLAIPCSAFIQSIKCEARRVAYTSNPKNIKTTVAVRSRYFMPLPLKDVTNYPALAFIPADGGMQGEMQIAMSGDSASVEDMLGAVAEGGDSHGDVVEFQAEATAIEDVEPDDDDPPVTMQYLLPNGALHAENEAWKNLSSKSKVILICELRMRLNARGDTVVMPLRPPLRYKVLPNYQLVLGGGRLEFRRPGGLKLQA